MHNNLYYCFVSHNSVVSQDYDRIKKMMYELDCHNYFVFYGGERHIENDHVVHIDCDDTYCGLPNKINYICKYLSNSTVDHILKIDRTVEINTLIPNNKIYNIDYAGRLCLFKSKTYHYSKCEKESQWYQRRFEGEEIKYCSGGGYILSKKAIDLIANDETYNDHVYEDYYVGNVLLNHGILPTHFPIKEYFYDPDHPKLFS